MSRIRTIKPELWTSPQFVRLSVPARLLFIGTLNFVDDGGRRTYDAVRFKMEIFPADPYTIQDVEGFLQEIVDSGLAQRYDCTGPHAGAYYWITKFAEHQRIDQPTYRFPAINGEIPTTPNRRRKATKSPCSANTQRTFDERSPPEGKGRDSISLPLASDSTPARARGGRAGPTGAPAARADQPVDLGPEHDYEAIAKRDEQRLAAMRDKS